MSAAGQTERERRQAMREVEQRVVAADAAVSAGRDNGERARARAESMTARRARLRTVVLYELPDQWPCIAFALRLEATLRRHQDKTSPELLDALAADLDTTPHRRGRR